MFRRLVLLLTVNLIGTKFTELFSALAALFLALVLQSFCNGPAARCALCNLIRFVERQVIPSGRRRRTDYRLSGISTRS